MIKNKQGYFIRSLAVFAAFIMLLCLNVGVMHTYAAANGIYIAAATPHYRHPGTGNIEDSGGEGSAVLGQSMTESATYTQALVEVDASGNTYVTVRLQLMDNIEGPQFKVDANRNGSFSSVSASLMQEDYNNNTADFRMKVPNENAVIRCTMYVVPMGRDVVFYITVSDLQPGSGDFITSIKVEETTKQQTTAAQTTQQSAQSENATPNDTVSESETSTSVTQTTSAAATTQSKDSTTKADLQEFDASGNAIQEEEIMPDSKEKTGKAGWIIGGIAVVAVIGACIWYFCFYKKKK